MTLQLPSASQSLKNEKKSFSRNHLISLLDGFCDFSGVEKSGLVFKGLSLNSKKVLEDYLFLACAGSSVNSGVRSDNSAQQQEQHGIAYAGDAINRGASCIVWEPTEAVNNMPKSCVVKGKPDVPLIPVEDLHAKVGEIAARFYEHPSRSVNMIGITGTNGKTSTAHFIAQLIHLISEDEENKEAECAVIGTLGNGFYGQLEKSTHTTPDAVTLQAMIAQLCEQQASTIVMEVSSHALAQGRVNSVDFDTAVFTNLTRDHLDYHGDMKCYSEEKMKLFQYDSLKHVVVNKDDNFAEDIIQLVEARQQKAHAAKLYTCSKVDKYANFFADDIKLHRKGITFNLNIKGNDSQLESYSVSSHLVGDFNIDNLMAALAVVHLQGCDMEKIVTAVAKIKTVPGRMEKITIENVSDDNLPLVVIDYAHTPDALEKGLMALRAHTQGRLTCVFGCGGDRDKGKRPLMAQVAEANSDLVMVTSDNPRSESADQIINDIMAGFGKEQKVSSELDRKKAINRVLETANKNDVIFIAGKGHEDYQEVNGQRIPFSDTDCVASFYSSRGKQ